MQAVSPQQTKAWAQAHLDGVASDEHVSFLEQNTEAWIIALRELRGDVQATIDRVAEQVTGPERGLVLDDFADELQRVERMLTELTGEELSQPERDDRREIDDDTADDTDDVPLVSGVAQLQLSWHRDRIVAWAAGHRATPEPADQVLERLTSAGASADRWEPADDITLPDGSTAAAVSAPVSTSLGWLVSLGADSDDDRGTSMTWMGLAAALAVRLVAQGRAVPQLNKVGDAPGNRSYFSVNWEPALIDHDEISELTSTMPGTVAVLERQRDARAVTQTVVAGFVDAICRDGAGRVEVPSPPPQPRNASDVAETLLCNLDGDRFEAPHQHGIEIAKGLRTWALGATGALKVSLTVKLDPPDDGGAWLLRTLTDDNGRSDATVEAAMSRASHNRKEALKRELERLERLYEPLMRSRDARRGQVVLSQDEAWDLMADIGPMLAAAGFDVQVPPLARRKATPSLRVTSVEAETAVGAQQLTSVRWSAVFDDVELTADDIRRLASESRPMVRSHGQWVEVDHADLEAAAEALAERANRTKLTGADMLRYALGLDGTALGRAVSVSGEGWAADLLRSAAEIPEHPPTRPSGFNGELRGYQGNALAWLEFLDNAGLGGCLALDMGLGKTPTVLAHLWRHRDRGPSLVIAPSAVVGNWAREADRFVPGLRTVIHHGTGRTDAADIAEEITGADVLVTTYGTAVRDIEGLTDVRWNKVVLDEAQVIKNPLSVTAQALRGLEAGNRIVLTGTPIENGLGDLWALMDFVNPGLVGDRATFVSQMHQAGVAGTTAESALRTLNGVLVFRRTKAEPVIAAELPDRIDKLNHCPMTAEQVGLYQAVLDELVAEQAGDELGNRPKGAVLAAITALKQICNHPEAYTGDGGPLAGRSGKLARLEEITDDVFEAGERMLVFTHFATWGEQLARHLSDRTGVPIACYHGGLTRTARDAMIREFQEGTGPGALVLSLKAGGTGLNLTSASHVVLYDRWWNPAVEDQARDRAWRIGQDKTVIAHRLVCPGTVDERVEEVVAGKRRIADLALPKSSSVDDLDSDQLRRALGIDTDALLTDEYADAEPIGVGGRTS
ncbi:MAG TPA: DEAD/DEAH box helicase [Euzebyales bacterium]